ncbi:MAG: AAA family ATPase [Pseudomonadota bacterium]
MILEGNERGHGAELARHLLNPRDNDHVTVHAVEGFVADDLYSAFAETEAISGGTQCQKYLFSLSLNPPSDAAVPVDVFEQAIADIERKLGLSGQPRAIVFHEKLGRRHAHCVWSRIDAHQIKAIKLSHYKRKLMDISRDLYRTHDWDIPEGFRDHDARDPTNFSRQEAGQAKRAKRDPKSQKMMFQECWAQSDSRAAFSAALWEQGYLLARGDRRGFVAVDQDGKIWSLSRWCGVKPKELRARLGSEDDLWSVDAAINAFKKLNARAKLRQPERNSERFEQRLKALVERQPSERLELKIEYAIRRDQTRLERKSRLPRGIKAIWARATGRYRDLIQNLATEAEKLQTDDRAEMQTLIEKHLAERKALEQERTQPDILAELQATFEKITRPDPRQDLVLPRDDIPFSQKQLLANPELILGYISEKDAIFSRTDVLRALAKRIQDPMALKLAADTAMASKELVLVDDAGKFTTKDYLSADAHLKSYAGILSKRSGFGVSTSHIDNAIAAQDAEMQAQFGGSLSHEQRAALRHILGGNQLANVVGLAGAGKSTMLKTALAAWVKQGTTVHGAALAGKAADGLETASDIPSRTLASLEASWKNGYEPINRGDVLVIDEAGMIGTRQLMRITQKMHEIGAKLVLVGDPEQLQPIEAGTPFRALIETHGASHLTQIHRQKHAWQRKASRDLSKGNIGEAITAYEEKGKVAKRSSHDTALAALVEDYVSDVELNGPETTRLAFAHRRKDVFALNQAIRAALRSSTDKSEDTLIETETGPRAFAPGDRVVFTRNERSLGVKNGQLGEVEMASPSVRRQVFWNQGRPELSESLAHLFSLIMRRVCGDASVALRVSFV